MSTKITNATKRKQKAAKKMAPMSESRLATINAQRVKQGLAPLSLAEANEQKKPAKTKAPKAKKAPKVKKPKVKKVKAVVVINDIAPSTLPVQELLAKRVTFREGGMLDVGDDLTAGEAVALVSFFNETAKSAGLHIGNIIVHCEKRKKATLDEIAKATKLERKTLHNFASAVRTTSSATIEGAMRKAIKSGHEITFSHVAAVAGLEPDKKKELLEEAATSGLTIAALNQKVRKLAPKTARRQKAETKKAAAQKAADDAKQAAAEAAANAPGAGAGTGTAGDAGAGTGGGGNVIVDAALSEDDEKKVEDADTHLDALVTFLRSALFGLLPVKRKVQFLKPLRQVADAYTALATELSNITGK